MGSCSFSKKSNTSKSNSTIKQSESIKKESIVKITINKEKQFNRSKKGGG